MLGQTTTNFKRQCKVSDADVLLCLCGCMATYASAGPGKHCAHEFMSVNTENGRDRVPGVTTIHPLTTPWIHEFQLSAAVPRHAVADFKSLGRPMEHQTTRRFDLR